VEEIESLLSEGLDDEANVANSSKSALLN
jgi:hypothetical protein